MQEECKGKNKYSKKMVYKTRKFVGLRRDKDVRIYKCDECHGYHITKKGTYE